MVGLANLFTPIVILSLVLGCSTLSVAESSADRGELFDLAKQALQKGNSVDALVELNKVLLSVWEACPLTARKSLLVSKKTAGFGMYEPRPNNIYKPGEPVLLYVQPIGYTHKKTGKFYEFGLTADFSLLSAGGDVLGGIRGFGNWVMMGHERNTEFFMNLTCTLTGVKPGIQVCFAAIVK